MEELLQVGVITSPHGVRGEAKVFPTTDDKELQDQYDCDYIVDEKDRTVSLTQKGIEKAEQFFNVLVPLGVPASWCVAVGQLIHQDQLRGGRLQELLPAQPIHPAGNTRVLQRSLSAL